MEEKYAEGKIKWIVKNCKEDEERVNKEFRVEKRKREGSERG